MRMCGFTLDDLEKCEMLVIDEVSMLSPLRLYQIDQRLRQAKPKKANKLFGGVSIVLMGDFAQLPPVCDKALFEVLLLSCIILEKKINFFSIANFGGPICCPW